MPKYQTDDDFKLRVKILSALAFVPVSDVVPNFESLAISNRLASDSQSAAEDFPLCSHIAGTRSSVYQDN